MTVAVSQEYPLFDGIAPSWADVETVINVLGGVTLKDIDYAGFKFGSVVEVGEQRGASGGRVMKRTTGSKKDSISATYYMSGYRKLVRALMENAPQRGNQRLISLVHFDIITHHSPPGETEIYEKIAKGCRLLGYDGTTAEGNDAEKIEITFSTAELAWKIDGVEVVLL